MAPCHRALCRPVWCIEAETFDANDKPRILCYLDKTVTLQAFNIQNKHLCVVPLVVPCMHAVCASNRSLEDGMPVAMPRIPSPLSYCLYVQGRLGQA